MSVDIRAAPLEAYGVRLEPLAAAHREGLRAAAATPEIWTWFPKVALGPDFDPWFDAALETALAGREAVWTVFDNAGQIAGSTRFLAIVPEHKRLEIGHTWYARQAWGGRTNPACKLALLTHGFERLGLNRIELKCDIANERSQAAIARLGAVREGVFRAHMVRRDGSLRDTVYFSIIRDDWPSVRAGLVARLDASNKGAA